MGSAARRLLAAAAMGIAAGAAAWADADPGWNVAVQVTTMADDRPLGGAAVHAVFTSGNRVILDDVVITGPSGVVDFVVPIVTGIDDRSEDAADLHALAVRPNPASGTAYLTAPLSRSMPIDVYDVRGCRLGGAAAGARVIDLGPAGLPGGVYFLRSRDGRGGATVSRFIVSGRLRELRLDTHDSKTSSERDLAPLTLTLDVSRHGYLDQHDVTVLPEGSYELVRRLEWDPSPALARTWLFCDDIGLNDAAVDSGWLLAASDTCRYDRTITADTTGFRYWQGYGVYPDSCAWTSGDFVLYTNGHRDDAPPFPSAWLGMFWMDLSDLAADDLVIENAWLIVSPSRWGSFPDEPDARCWAVMDTTIADRAWIQAPPVWPQDDPRVRAATWNQADRVAGQPWKPSLASRDDWHDFGPRSRPRPGGAPELSAVRFDVTDVLQQYVDRGARRVNAGWIVTGSSRYSYPLSLGTSLAYQAANHQPVLVVTWSRRERVRPWGGFGLPFVMMLDDNDTCQIAYAQVCREHQQTFSSVVPGCAIRGYSTTSPCNLSVSDLVTLADDGFGVVMHSRFHSDLGTIAFGDRVATDRELQRRWIRDVWGAETDTASFATFAWPFLGQGPVYSPWMLKELVAYGYSCARAAGSLAWEEGLGHTTRLSWDGIVNLYAIASDGAWDLVGDSDSDPGPAQIAENVADLINRCWQDGRAPVLLFWHDTKASGGSDPCSWPMGVDVDEFGWTLDAIEARDNVWTATFPDVVSTYLQTAEYLDPDPSFAASFYDSLLNLGHEEFRRMWTRQLPQPAADRGGAHETWRP